MITLIKISPRPPKHSPHQCLFCPMNCSQTSHMGIPGFPASVFPPVPPGEVLFTSAVWNRRNALVLWNL